MFVNCKSTLVLLFAGICCSLAASIPSYIHICKRNDPAVGKCIIESVEHLRPKLRKGIPELGVPSMEPLFLDEIIIARGGDSSLFRAAGKNVKVYGASDFKITKLKADIKNLIFRIGVTMPALNFEGDYDVDARILVVPIKGSGTFTANATDITANGVLSAEIVPDNGQKIMKFNSLELDVQIGDYAAYFNNLFNGDPVLGRAANDVVNNNRQELISGAKAFIESKVSQVILSIANKITVNFHVDEVFPEN